MALGEPFEFLNDGGRLPIFHLSAGKREFGSHWFSRMWELVFPTLMKNARVLFHSNPACLPRPHMANSMSLVHFKH